MYLPLEAADEDCSICKPFVSSASARSQVKSSLNIGARRMEKGGKDKGKRKLPTARRIERMGQISRCVR